MSAYNTTEHLLRSPKRASGIKYPDITPLLRSQRQSTANIVLLSVCIVAAIALGALFVYFAYDNLFLEPQREKQEIYAAIDREVDYDFPPLLAYIDLSNDDILNALNAQGKNYTILELFNEGVEGFDLYKFSSDTTPSVGEQILEDGISNLDAVDAAMFLKGSWRITMYRYTTNAIKLKYALFNCLSAQDAIEHALSSQGWVGLVTVEDSGVDSAGNTFEEGTLVHGDKGYQFRISVIELSEMYSVGLPDEAYYIGIKLTQIVSA